MAPFAEISDQAFDDVLRTNLFGAFYFIRAALPAMEVRGYGRVVATCLQARPDGIQSRPPLCGLEVGAHRLGRIGGLGGRA
jgi:NAD(P)-dependent dehydrogenase (short-subunit alcohol dehydrogenase family)